MPKTALASLIALSCAGLYALAGFFVLPYAAKPLIQKQLQQRYNVDLKLKTIDFNPFLLQTNINHLQLSYKDSELLTLRSASLDLSFWPLLQKQIDIENLQLNALSVHAALDANSSLNLVSVFANDTQNTDTVQTPASSWNIRLQKGALHQSYIHFTDKSRSKLYSQSIGPLEADIADLALNDGAQSTYGARLDLGAFGTLSLSGDLRTAPLSGRAEINWQHLQLEALQELFPGLPLTLQKGRAWLQTRIRLRSEERLFVRFPRLRAGADNIAIAQKGQKLFTGKAIGITARNLRLQPGKNTGVQSTHTTLNAWQPTLYDPRLVKGFAHRFDKAALTLRDFSLRRDFDLDAGLVRHDQRINIKGKTNLQSKQTTAQVSTDNLDLSTYNDYIAAYANLRINSARLEGNGTVTAAPKTPPHITADISVTDSNVTSSGLPLFAAKKLLIQGVQHKNGDTAIENIALRGGNIWLIKDTARLQTARILKNGANTGQNSTADSGTVSVHNLAVSESSLYYRDLTTTPQTKLKLHEMDLNATAIAQNVRTHFLLNARMNRQGSVRAKLSTNVFNPLQRLQAQGSVRSLNLQRLSAYGQSAIGRKLLQGRMDLDFDYNIKNKQLDGANQLRLSHLRVSDHLPQSSAQKLPVGLAIALLQDRNKLIDLDIKLHNDLGAPEFTVKNLIPTMLANVITKAAASPFSMLSKIAGIKGDALSFSRFAPASATLSQKQKHKLDALVSALMQRPGLELMLQGGYDSESDREAFKQQLLAQKLQKKSLPEIAENMKIKTAKDSAAKLWQAVLQQLSLPKNKLPALAKQRGKAVREYLEASKIGPSRISIQKDIRKDTQNVTFTLRSD